VTLEEKKQPFPAMLRNPYWLSGFVSLRNQFLWDESNANNQSTQQYRFLHALPPQKFLY
jgi:hypothetical protein